MMQVYIYILYLCFVLRVQSSSSSSASHKLSAFATFHHHLSHHPKHVISPTRPIASSEFCAVRTISYVTKQSDRRNHLVSLNHFHSHPLNYRVLPFSFLHMSPQLSYNVNSFCLCIKNPQILQPNLTQPGASSHTGPEKNFSIALFSGGASTGGGFGTPQFPHEGLVLARGQLSLFWMQQWEKQDHFIATSATSCGIWGSESEDESEKNHSFGGAGKAVYLPNVVFLQCCSNA